MARRTFFSFHYAPDVWRAWNVRNSWVVTKDEQQDSGFFDSSVFEAAKKTSPENLKAFLRDGLQNSSVTCVLTGSQTWLRRWVRYEIARSVVRGNALLTVDIDGVKNKDGQTSEKGPDPLANMGLYKTDSGIYLAEWKDRKWVRYEDYSLAIPAANLWFPLPTDANVVALAKHCLRYDFARENGRQNIGGWIETAASLAGR